MTDLMNIAGVRLSEANGHYFVDGEKQKSVDTAVEVFFARCYPSTQDLPVAIITYIRRMAGWQLASPQTMLRRSMFRGGTTTKELAAKSGISQRTIQRVLRGEQDPKSKTLFHLMHSAEGR